jgi:hypothetical protein
MRSAQGLKNMRIASNIRRIRRVCGNTHETTTERLLQIAPEAQRGGVQVDMRRFVAA